MSQTDANPWRPLADAQATQALGAELTALLRPQHCADPTLHATSGDPAAILLLAGDLGAGKTCLVQGLGRALGIEEPITSPTFALAQHYRSRDGSAALVHLDLYRLEQPAAADELFAQEAEEAAALGALLAVEWPERLSAYPTDAWLLELSLAGSGRRARLTPPRR